MQIIADLHLHSKYSRAVSPEMVLPKMAWWAKRKGINLLGTGDFTHPLWLREIKANLEEAGEGIYGLKDSVNGASPTNFSIASSQNDSSISGHSTTANIDQDIAVRRHSKIVGSRPLKSGPFFLLSTEISSIYSQGGKVRRIHNVVLAPSIETVEKINNELIKRGCNLHSDGRPIIGIPAYDLVKIILSIDERALIIPAHAWTPWFSLYGSQSGFDSIDECFGEMDKYIYGVETGLSSDPAMNWRIADLDHRSIISSSDAHSGPKLGREATVFETKEVSYGAVREAISQIRPTGQIGKNRIAHTLEFYPEEGKYHYTGHRACSIKQTPEETKRLGETCSVCGKHLTVGVMHRVEQLAQHNTKHLTLNTKIDEFGVKWIGYEDRPPYTMLVPLQEIIAESMRTVPASIKVQNEYEKLTAESARLRQGFGEVKGEFGILLNTPIEEIAKISGEKIAEGIRKVRGGEISVDPGYDGVFGVVKIWSFDSAQDKGDKENEKKEQMSLF